MVNPTIGYLVGLKLSGEHEVELEDEEVAEVVLVVVGAEVVEELALDVVKELEVRLELVVAEAEVVKVVLAAVVVEELPPDVAAELEVVLELVVA